MLMSWGAGAKPGKPRGLQSHWQFGGRRHHSSLNSALGNWGREKKGWKKKGRLLHYLIIVLQCLHSTVCAGTCNRNRNCNCNCNCDRDRGTACPAAGSTDQGMCLLALTKPPR